MSVKHTPPLRARALILLVVAGLGILVTFWMLNSYKMDLVYRVVVNAVIQKAPPDYPAITSRAYFNAPGRRLPRVSASRSTWRNSCVSLTGSRRCSR